VDQKLANSPMCDKLTVLVQLNNMQDYEYMEARLSSCGGKIFLTRPGIDPSMVTHGHRLIRSMAKTAGEDLVRTGVYNTMLNDLGTKPGSIASRSIHVPGLSRPAQLPMTEQVLLLPPPFLASTSFFNGEMQGKTIIKKHLVRLMGGSEGPKEKVLKIFPQEGMIPASEDEDGDTKWTTSEEKEKKAEKAAMQTMLKVLFETPTCFYALFEMSVPETGKGFGNQNIEDLTEDFDDLDFS
jgi:hypothetical protein